MTPKLIKKGAIPMVENLPRRAEKALPFANASCLVTRSISKSTPAPMLKAAVSPMAAMLVTVLTVLTDTVVIIIYLNCSTTC